MKWYSLNEKVPKRGEKLILVEGNGSRVSANFIYDSEFYDSDEDLEREVWGAEKRLYSRWGYMDEFLKEVFGE